MAGAPRPHLTLQVNRIDALNTCLSKSGPPSSSPSQAWLAPHPLAENPDISTSKAQRFQMQNTSPEKAKSERQYVLLTVSLLSWPLTAW